MEHIYKVQPVQIWNQSINLINIDNVYYLPFRRLCEIAGLEISSQTQRLQRDNNLLEGTVKIKLASKSGIQETLILRLDLTINWLNTIKVNKVKNGISTIIHLMKEDINKIFELLKNEKELSYLRKEKARIEKRIKRDTLILNGLNQLELTYLKFQ